MPESQPAPRRAAIYCRISKDSEDQREGVDRQEVDCRALAERLGYEVVGVYIDNDVSASTSSSKPRPEYEEVLNLARSGQIDAIFAYSLSRLTRRVRQFLDLIDLHRATGVLIKTCVSGDPDLATADGRGQAINIANWDQMEAERTAERVRRAKGTAAEKGKYRGGPRPFGYKKDGVTPLPSEAAIVLEATRAILAGRTLASVARELRGRGVTGTQGRPVTYNNLRDLLIRPRNAGILAHGLPNRAGPGNKSSKPYEVVKEDAWPAIVPPEEWRALKDLLTDPARRTYEGNNRESKYLGSSIYRCGIEGCGGKMRTAPNGGTPSKPHSRHTIYRCTSSAHLTVRQDMTDDYVRKVVAEMIRDPKIRARLHPSADGIDLSEDNAERAALVVRLGTLPTALAVGDLTPQQVRQATERINTLISDIDVRAAKLLHSAVSMDILRASDPGQAFLDSPLDIQRAVLSTVLRVEVVPQARRGLSWSPQRLRLSPTG